jgi:hypothetical protein
MLDVCTQTIAFGSSKFSLGQISATSAVLRGILREDLLSALDRHVSGDWGDVDNGRWKANEQSLHKGGRLLSQYHSGNSQSFFIETEADRSVTRIWMAENETEI